jgi:hypothetical protein
MIDNSMGMYQGYSVEGSAELKVTPESTMKQPMAGAACCGNTMSGVVCPPVMECPIEKQIHRQIVHEVPHVCPINTRIINHHVYRHTYSPCYSCTEENQVCSVNEGCCGRFM